MGTLGMPRDLRLLPRRQVGVEFLERMRCLDLEPGDLFGSGTVGKGCGLELDRWLKPGDIVELEIEGIGILKNRVVKP